MTARSRERKASAAAEKAAQERAVLRELLRTGRASVYGLADAYYDRPLDNYNGEILAPVIALLWDLMQRKIVRREDENRWTLAADVDRLALARQVGAIEQATMLAPVGGVAGCGCSAFGYLIENDDGTVSEMLCRYDFGAYTRKATGAGAGAGAPRNGSERSVAALLRLARRHGMITAAMAANVLFGRPDDGHPHRAQDVAYAASVLALLEARGHLAYQGTHTWVPVLASNVKAERV